MKIFISTAIFLLFISSYETVLAQNGKNIPDALTVIHSRKSVRHFTGQPVA